MKPVLVKASGVFLGVLAAVLAWLLVAATSLASAGGPDPLYLRGLHPVTPSSPASTFTVTVVLIAALLGVAVVLALLLRRADRRATLAEVASLDAQRERDEQQRKAA